MQHAALTSDTKANTVQGKTQVTPQPERELHPHVFNAVGRYPAGGMSGNPGSSAGQQRHVLAGMQQTRGNQAVLRMLHGSQQMGRIAALRPSQGVMVQRKCACGGSGEAEGECAECKAKSEGALQRKVANSPVSPADAQGVPPVVHDVLGSPGQTLDAGTRAFMEPRFGHDFSQIPIYTSTTRAIQTKLVINKPGDEYEHEADRISDLVMRMPASKLSIPHTHARLSRKCAACEEELQRASVSPATLGGQPAPLVVHQVLAEPGRPLDPKSRAFFEPRFGMDLGHVRVHDDTQAANSARAVGARAYTVGSHIAFADRADTVSEGGRLLLAHELVHVVQQTGDVTPKLARDDAPYTPSSSSSVLANAADRIAGYRGRATTALSGSGLEAADADRIRRNLATCEAGEEQLRSVAQAGDDAASASVLSAFTFDGLRQVIPSLTSVKPAPKAVAVNETDNGELATMPTSGADFSDPVEREAERVAAELVPTGALTLAPEKGNVLHRYLNAQDMQQIEQAVAPAAPAIVAGTATAAVAIATAPLWVWIVAAVVVVAIAAAVFYWVFSKDASEAVKQPQPQPQPQPTPQPQPQPQPQPRNVPQECIDQANQLSQLGCGRFEARQMAPNVRNPQADVYCHDITGSECEYWLYPPGGNQPLAKFDGVRGRDVIECKCGYDHFIDDLTSPDNFKRGRAEKVLGDDIIKQILSHLRYTQDCHLQYRIIVSSQRLADWIRNQLGNQVDVIVQPSEECD